MRKFYSMLIITGFILILIFANCSTEKLDRIIRMKDKGINPKWDLNIKIPVLEKNIYMKNYMNNITITPYETTGLHALPVWPVSISRTEIISGFVPIDINVDFNPDDGVDNDLKIYGLYSKEASCFIDVWLTDGIDTQALLIQNKDISFSTVNIEGHVYTGDFYSSENNIITYKLNDFPSINEGYFINFAGDNNIENPDNCNFDNLTVNLNSGTAVYLGGNYIVHVRARLLLGENFGIAAKIINNSDLKNEQNISIPIKDIPYNNLDNFRIIFSFSSTIPFDLIMINRIRTKDNSLIQDKIVNILSGKLEYLPQNNYHYLIEKQKTNDSFSVKSDFFDKSDVVMDYSIRVNASNDIILLHTDADLSIQTAIECDGEFNF